MKNFKNFYEDTRELRKQLHDIDVEDSTKRKQEIAARNLQARREAAKRRINDLAGNKDTETRLSSAHSSDLEKIRRIQTLKREKNKTQNNKP
jgi:hypothetical protein